MTWPRNKLPLDQQAGNAITQSQRRRPHINWGITYLTPFCHEAH
jgi:hypothetical protein